MTVIGKAIPRVESKDKVTGVARYTNDTQSPGHLHGWLLTSPHAHARIQYIDYAAALQVTGVHAVVTGADHSVLVGSGLADRPPIAKGKVRYYGEPYAVVVADNEHIAKEAARLIRTGFEPLPVVNSPSSALRAGAPLIHENLASYPKTNEVHPVPGTNIGNHVKIRKGDMQAGWALSEVVVEDSYAFNTSDHSAMEPRCAIVEVKPDGTVEIETSTQDPFTMKRFFQRFFGIDQSKIIVRVPLVGGAFGGKGSVQLEYIGYLASLACGGRPVKVNNTRETDMIGSPSHIGLEARVKLGATRDGLLTAAEITLLFDNGGYTDEGAAVTESAAVDCTGPYRIEHVHCDALSVYTNHPYATAFRGFGHTEVLYCTERAMDKLAKKLQIDPLELRYLNAIQPGDITPTQTLLNHSSVGDLRQCIRKLNDLMQGENVQQVQQDPFKVRATGISCVWKVSGSMIDTGSGATITFNHDGSLNLSVGSIEIGQGNRTAMAQLAAERMNMPVHQVHIKLDVDTQITPEHWKTVASSSTMMVGRAVLDAADDAITQLKHNASVVLNRPPEELVVGGGNVYVKNQPGIYLEIRMLVSGYMYPGGRASGNMVIGRGRYRVHHQKALDPETGKGIPGQQWTVSAHAVLVEFDTRECTYRIMKAASVIDVGKVINAGTAHGQVVGGMNMGLSFASREAFLFNKAGIVLNPQLRTYKITRFGDQPEYLVDFVETPFVDGPYGARGVAESGTIGMPGALANALSIAAGVELNQLPLTPELIWRARGAAHDLF
ncbi:Putative xanthine dehydrogenase molybdenum-binding subunit XdhA [Paenibacillus allorhizoplanae]|uniref:Xanthine dehydrogenase molybdenum-binding subunit XdhA n=1 Tax=Paenibacillus allorhizoplanae TaxID=2905648 RepID=A0ABM9CST7_9BACL|nr:xanthine dehydrogenase family protein molybdopterin-binding subunit [Paenibacillus allorhizoplanae]CAH1222432.1 Putative xanthine dehydrogenase molybdenum-binding subunit XdhA [Paenibacillus allorhizoplanae]